MDKFKDVDEDLSKEDVKLNLSKSKEVFIDIDSSLSDNQHKAVCSCSRQIAVVAGPGSGKTRVLTERIHHLVANMGVAVEQILALSFSSKATREMRKRLNQRFGKDLPFVVKTFHSLGLQIIRENIDLIGARFDFEIANLNERCKIIRELCPKNSEKEVMEILQEISSCKNGLSQYDNMCDEYNSKLMAYNYIDFDDMIAIPRDILMNHKEVANAYRKKYKYIFVDEVQDLNKYQIDIVKELCDDETNLFVVGDDDQCIYEWRGAEPDFLRSLVKGDDVEVIRLNDNFRSASPIVGISKQLINNNKNRIQKSINSKYAKKQIIKDFADITVVKRLNSELCEANYIANEIKSLVDKGRYVYSDFTVLIRGKKQANEICLALERLMIPCFKQVNDVSDYDEFVIVLQAILDLKSIYKERNHKNSRLLGKAVNFPYSVMDNFAFAEIAQKFDLDTTKDLLYLFNKIYYLCGDFEDSDIFRQRFGLIKELSEKLDNLSAYQVIERLYKQYKAERFASKNNIKKKLEHIQTLIEIARDFECNSQEYISSLQKFVDYLTLSKEDGSVEDNTENAVNIITCHKSKGWNFLWYLFRECK